MIMQLSKPVLQDPIISQRSPFETYLLLIGLLAGARVLFGGEVSGTLKDTLSPDLTLLWGLFVFVGCLVALIGMSAPQRRPFWMVLGLHVERFGLTLLAGACGVFGYLMWREAGDAGAFVAGQNIAFALACGTRVVQIARRFSWYYRESGLDGEAS